MSNYKFKKIYKFKGCAMPYKSRPNKRSIDINEVKMIETYGIDIFDQISIADAICITTNCSTYMQNNNIINPMGALAGAAASRWQEIPTIYGNQIFQSGAVPVILGFISKQDNSIFANFNSHLEKFSITNKNFTALIAFPTMYKIGEPASLSLIKRSAELLAEMINNISNDSNLAWNKIYLGAPGIGVGGLKYNDVKNIISPILDDRFIVMQK